MNTERSGMVDALQNHSVPVEEHQNYVPFKILSKHYYLSTPQKWCSPENWKLLGKRKRRNPLQPEPLLVFEICQLNILRSMKYEVNFFCFVFPLFESVRFGVGGDVCGAYAHTHPAR